MDLAREGDQRGSNQRHGNEDHENWRGSDHRHLRQHHLASRLPHTNVFAAMAPQIMPHLCVYRSSLALGCCLTRYLARWSLLVDLHRWTIKQGLWGCGIAEMAIVCANLKRTTFVLQRNEANFIPGNSFCPTGPHSGEKK